jgi:pimeloyl-ACP methyl ester carboxylesterase
MTLVPLMFVTAWAAFEEPRYEMGVRLRQLDAAWVSARDPARKEAAVAHVADAVASFFQNRTREACVSLDHAWAALNTANAEPGLGVTARTAPYRKGEEPELRLWLTYGDKPVTVLVDGNETVVGPGQDVRVPTRNSVTLQAGSRTLVFEAPPTDSQAESVARLASSQDPIVKGLAEYAGTVLARKGEVDDHFDEALALAESLDKGETQPNEATELFFARHGPTVFRARFPRIWSEPRTVVIGLHGAGGSENLFFEGYGRGAAPAEAVERGWGFFAPRSAPRAAGDCLEWLSTVHGFTPERVFVMGHSMGGGMALGTHALNPKPMALGLFAPAARTLPEPFRETPVFLAVGAQEMSLLKDNAMRLADRLSDGSVFKTYPNCEHLMIVADAVLDCFRFFDGLGNSRTKR